VSIWGTVSAFGGPVLTEVHPDGTVAFEMSFPAELASYRAFRFPWASGLPAAEVTINEVFQGNTYTFNELGDSTGVKIKFNYIESILYNAVIVKRYEYAPENTQFNGRAPGIYPAKAEIKALGIDSLNVDIYFQLNHYPQVSDPQNTIIYQRSIPSAGIFTPLTTTYNSGTNELKVSSVTQLGEFIFGYPDVPVVTTIPSLVHPEDNQLVNNNLPLNLEWSPEGFANKFHLQVSTESNFGSTEVNDSTLTTPSYTIDPIITNQQYFWRVKSKNLAGWGGWSEVWSFTSTTSFLDLVLLKGSRI